MSKIKVAALVAAGAALVVVAGTGGAVASSLIHGSDIASSTITSRNLADSAVRNANIGGRAVSIGALSNGVKGYINEHAGKDGLNGLNGARGPVGPQGATGATGATGPQGPAGPAGKDGTNGTNGRDGLAGAVYRVEVYKNGGGGSATVACADDDATSQQYTAIAGGVQGSTVGTQSASGFAVSSSFPGRMDWSTNTPKPNRLDGWIILGNGVHTSTLKVWALCVPTTDIAVQTVNLDN